MAANPWKDETPDDEEVAQGEVVGDIEPYVEVGPAEVAQYLSTMQSLVVDDPEAVALKIAQRRLAARNIDDLLAPQEVHSARDYLHQDIRVLEVHFNRSRFDGQDAGVYAIVEAVVTLTGERVTISCGASDVLVQLYKLVDWNALPLDVRIVPSRNPTQAGYYPLHLEAAPKPAPSF